MAGMPSCATLGYFVRYFLRRFVPPSSRMLLVESGSRRITQIVIPHLRAHFGEGMAIDVLTCLPDPPAGAAEIFSVNDYRGRRMSLVRELRGRGYVIAAIICSGEVILNKWKWGLATALPAKFLVINENGDYFWLDRGHWPAIRQFVKHRAGLANAGIVRAVARIFVFPFTLAYLLLYAAAVHVRRALYRGFR
jgi:hypothetical protein